MKRILAMLMVVLLLTGCSGNNQAPTEPGNPPAADQEEIVMSEPKPAPEQEPEVESVPEVEADMEADPTPSVKPEPKPEPKPAIEPEEKPDSELIPEWEAFAANIYQTITEQEEFRILIGQEGTETELVFRQTLDEMSPVYFANSFANYDWSEADSADWIAMMQEADAAQLSFSLPGELTFTCRENGSIVEIMDQTKITYLKAEGHSGTGDLYDLLKLVPEDLVAQQVWNVTVDGAVSLQEAAGRMAEKVAENYRAVPEWVSWNAETVKAERAEVYDIYRGTPEEFCFNLGLAVKVADPMAPEAGYWQAGSGLGGADENGFYGWEAQVRVRKDETGQWVLRGWGTGGSVSPEQPAEKSWIEWLVELFCLTEGYTHDWVAPSLLLMHAPDQMEGLPAILDQLTEEESRELCSVLGDLLEREDLVWDYTKETLMPLLGDYGVWLDT